MASSCAYEVATTGAFLSAEPPRRTSFCKAASSVVNIRKSSVFLDYESTTRALADSQNKLSKALTLISELEARHNSLVTNFEMLTNKYASVKAHAVDCAWHYCLEKSGDFKYMPLMDKDLLETDSRVGDYSMQDLLGKGQFSIVRSCGKMSASSLSHASTERGSNSNNNHSSHHKNGIPGSSSGRGGHAGVGVGVGVGVSGRFAVKVIAKEKLTSIEMVLRIERELHALTILTPHPNVVAFTEALHGQQSLYIVTEWFPMDLFEFIESHQTKINDNVVAVVLRELLDGLAHLGSHGIAHRDLKPENVLIHVGKNDVSVKLCDFGLCSFLPEGSSILTDFW